MNYFIYVALSECKTITKVGMSATVKARVSTFKTQEGQPYSVLFHSEPLTKQRTYEIENLVNKQFKQDVIKGNEWYSTKPILIIEYLIKELDVNPFVIGEWTTEFPSWEENLSTYRNAKQGKEIPLIREMSTKGLYYISYLDGDEFKQIGFCNYGDAREFYFTNLLFIKMADTMKEDLYNLTKGNPVNLLFSGRKEVYYLREKIIEVKKSVDTLI